MAIGARRESQSGKWNGRGTARGRELHTLASCVARLLVAVFVVLASMACVRPALAMEPIVIGKDQDRIEITRQGDYYEGRGDRLQIDTAPGGDGVVGRMAVKATTAGTNPGWVVFAIRNPTDKLIERWLTADRYNIIGSGLVWPDLDARRIEALTPSVGEVPRRIPSDRADIFRIAVEAGQTITFVAELASERVPGMFLWNAVAYEQKQRGQSLFNGILLGIIGLLALFLTAIFAANHKAIFPSAALVAWCVLAYLCIDFGFWHRLFQLRAEDNAAYRAAAEAASAASFAVFLYAFLRIGLWSAFVRLLFGLWLLIGVAILVCAAVDPRLAAMLARASLVPLAVFGSMLLLYLSLRGQDRALSLVPTWLLLLVWLFGAAVTVTGKLHGDAVQSALTAGLVLIVVLIGFTVTQFAFRAGDALHGGTLSQAQLRSMAIDVAGANVWEWNARRDEVVVSPNLEAALGRAEGELSRRVDDFLGHMHPQDRERFKQVLTALRERNGGTIHIEFRLKHADGTHHWYELEGGSVPHADHKTLKCAGIIRDINDAKRAQERLVHDAVHDSLTGFPNRELFLDRLEVAMSMARHEGRPPPVVLFIGIDRFKAVNTAFGLIIGDGLLLTMARRLSRHLGPRDTVARIGGDQFAILITSGQPPADIAMFAERVRRTLRTPVKISGQDIVLTGSIGISGFDGKQATPQDVLREAELAMQRAKQGGADRIDVFKADMRDERGDRAMIEAELRKAIETGQLRIFYQPIIRLPQEALAGFEAVVRWQHPRLGLMRPEDFMSAAEDDDLVAKLGTYVLEQASADAGRWQKALPRDEAPLYVAVNVSSRQLFRQELVAEFRHIIGRQEAARGTLRLEVSEQLLMENPEQAVETLEWLKSAGAGLSLDEFGTGHASFAYLHRFPFDTLKLDRSLLRSSADEATGQAIVKAMVTLAHEVGKEVVAEGVETLDDVSFLRAVGCDYAQGYYYGEPMGERDVLELLALIRAAERTDTGWLSPRRRRAKGGRDGETGEPIVAPPPPSGGPPPTPTTMSAPVAPLAPRGPAPIAPPPVNTARPAPQPPPQQTGPGPAGYPPPGLMPSAGPNGQRPQGAVPLPPTGAHYPGPGAGQQPPRGNGHAPGPVAGPVVAPRPAAPAGMAPRPAAPDVNTAPPTRAAQGRPRH